jgi:hypothetical protein
MRKEKNKNKLGPAHPHRIHSKQYQQIVGRPNKDLGVVGGCYTPTWSV